MSITDQSNVIARKGSVIWDLRTEAADLVDCLPASARTILDNIRQTGITFAARTTSPFDEPRFFRPSRHIRAFYQRVDDWQDGDSEAVVAYKGSEVWSEDLKSVAAAMSEVAVYPPSICRAPSAELAIGTKMSTLSCKD